MLVALARQCRLRFAAPAGSGDSADAEWAAAAVEQWAAEQFTPHVSLVYSACASADVPLQAALDAVLSAGIVIRAGDCVGEDEREGEGEGEGEGEKGLAGWTGGRVAIVQTWKDLAEWTVLAERIL